MRAPILMLVLVVGLGGCKALAYVPLEDLDEEEVAQFESEEGLAVAGYISDRGTKFGRTAHARRRPGGRIEFAPHHPGPLFPGPVTVRAERVKGLGLQRTSWGKTLGVVVLTPVVIGVVVAGTAAGAASGSGFKSHGSLKNIPSPYGGKP